MYEVECPYCGYEKCEADFVDNGVGNQQVGPYGCPECHAFQIGPYDKINRKLTENVNAFKFLIGA